MGHISQTRFRKRRHTEVKTKHRITDKVLVVAEDALAMEDREDPAIKGASEAEGASEKRRRINE